MLCYKIEEKKCTLRAVPSLPERFSRMTKRVPYLEDLISTHFINLVKFSSKGSDPMTSHEDGSFRSIGDSAEVASFCSRYKRRFNEKKEIKDAAIGYNESNLGLLWLTRSRRVLALSGIKLQIVDHVLSPSSSLFSVTQTRY